MSNATSSFNQPTPPHLLLRGIPDTQVVAARLSGAREALLQKSLYAAMLRHIGYMPEPAEFKQRAHCQVLHDGTRCYLWDGEEFYRNKLTMQFTPGS